MWQKIIIMMGLTMLMILLVMSITVYAQKKDDKEQKDVFVWCIGNENNAVAVKTPKNLLIFDYCFEPYSKLPADSEKGILNDGKTIVPKEIENENTFLFVTHSHEDHYDPAIQKLAEKVKKIHYIVPDCMKKEFSKLTNCTTTIGKDTKEVSGLKVHPIYSAEGPEGGCCYLIEVDKIIIAYINTCYSVEETSQTLEFILQLPKLLGAQRIDLAFICPFVQLKFLAGYEPRVIIPVHGDKDNIKITEQFDKESKNVNLKMGEKYIYSMNPKPSSQKEANKPSDTKSQATIRYLGHSGVAIKTNKHFLIFDGELGGAIKPAEIKDENVLVFVSHEHGDHCKPGITSLQKIIKNIKYIVPTNELIGEADYFASSFKNQVAKENLIEISTEKAVTASGATISAIKASDSGVGFLVEVDGLVIFHAGDHALWSKDIEESYQEEIKKVKGANIDIAFLPLQPNHPNKEIIRQGALWAVKELAPKVVTPIHLFENYAEGETFVKLIREQKLNSQPFLMKDRKKTYLYQDGKITEK